MSDGADDGFGSYGEYSPADPVDYTACAMLCSAYEMPMASRLCKDQCGVVFSDSMPTKEPTVKPTHPPSPSPTRHPTVNPTMKGTVPLSPVASPTAMPSFPPTVSDEEKYVTALILCARGGSEDCLGELLKTMSSNMTHVPIWELFPPASMSDGECSLLLVL